MTAPKAYKVWEDPLSFDPLAEGPPYLGTHKPMVASLVGGMSWSDLFEATCREYGSGAVCAELGALLALYRAEAILHQAHHWQTRGQTYYGDHLLFERAYNEVNGMLDNLAERAVGLASEDLVNPVIQVGQVQRFMLAFHGGPTRVEPLIIGLSALAVNTSLLCTKQAYSALESKSGLTLGLDNLLQGFADKLETLAYLFGQRIKTASFDRWKSDQ